MFLKKYFAHSSEWKNAPDPLHNCIERRIRPCYAYQRFGNFELIHSIVERMQTLTLVQQNQEGLALDRPPYWHLFLY